VRQYGIKGGSRTAQEFIKKPRREPGNRTPEIDKLRAV
jgi:hypothetical protein